MKKASDLRIPFTWEERRPVLLDRAFYIPRLYDDHEKWGRLDWSEGELFGNDLPVVIEFCCGNGQWIGSKAKANPDLNWVGVDKLFERARKLWAKIHRENLPNLFAICTEASLFIRHYVKPKSVDAVHINFPDPWPKRRHEKKRLVNREFLQTLSNILKPGALLHLATDDLTYLEWALKELSFCPNWRSIYPAPNYATNLADFGRSFFGDLWQERGRTIYHIKYAYDDHG
jgi:tRNA (guanine-N7-)-methyltransferase